MKAVLVIPLDVEDAREFSEAMHVLRRAVSEAGVPGLGPHLHAAINESATEVLAVFDEPDAEEQS